MRKINFDNKKVSNTAFGIILALLLLNFYYLYTGNYYALIPIILQTVFVTLFYFNHLYFRKLGLFLFALILISGSAGFVNIAANSLLYILDVNRADFSKFELSNLIRQSLMVTFGFFFFYSMIKTRVQGSNYLEKKILQINRVSFLRALKDAAILRIIIFVISIGIGIVFGILDYLNVAHHSNYTLYINFGEHFLLLIGICFFINKRRYNFFYQTMILSLFNWLLLLPFMLSNITRWATSIYFFLVEGIIAISIVLITKHLVQKTKLKPKNLKD